MRICKIVGCQTNSSHKERNIFEYVKKTTSIFRNPFGYFTLFLLLFILQNKGRREAKMGSDDTKTPNIGFEPKYLYL